MNKLNAAFIGVDPEKIRSVYGESRMAEIAGLTNPVPGIITDKTFDQTDLSKVDILFSTWGMLNFTEEQLDKMPNLKAVFYAAGATDYFCRPLLNRGIKVISAWQANSIPVAEFATAQIILGLKNYFQLARRLHSKENWTAKFSGPGAYGKTVALLGAGAISTRVQAMLKNYDLKVIVVPSRKEHRTISLEEAFAQSQVVSCHLPNRDDNVGVLNGKMFASMPENGVFINTGRGRQVNEEELCDVLEQRPDLTALLDVTAPEPPENGSRLYTLPNVFLSPHIAGSLNDEFKRMADFVIVDLKNYLDGKPLLYQVTENMLLTSTK